MTSIKSSTECLQSRNTSTSRVTTSTSSKRKRILGSSSKSSTPKTLITLLRMRRSKSLRAPFQQLEKTKSGKSARRKSLTRPSSIGRLRRLDMNKRRTFCNSKSWMQRSRTSFSNWLSAVCKMNLRRRRIRQLELVVST